jgi:hypothetical protein
MSDVDVDVDVDMPMEEQAERLRTLSLRLYHTLCDMDKDPGLDLEDMACLIGANVKTAARYAKNAGLHVPDEYAEST